MPGFGCACSVTVPGGYVEWATECGIFFLWLLATPEATDCACSLCKDSQRCLRFCKRPYGNSHSEDWKLVKRLVVLALKGIQ